jgi:hypothetical protein
MGVKCIKYREIENTVSIFGETFAGNRLFQKPNHKWKDNNKIDPKKMM